MAWLFWIAIALVAFAYVGYPVLMALLAAVRRRPVNAVEWPARVDALVVVHNAAGLLEAKVANLLALDYAAERLHVHVVLDGCSDGTARVAARLAAASARVQVHAFEQRQGKSACIARVLPPLTADAVLFSDARPRLDPGAPRALGAALGPSPAAAARG